MDYTKEYIKLKHALRLRSTDKRVASIMTPADFDILIVTLFTWTLKVRSSSSITPRSLIVETFVRIESWIVMSSNELIRLDIIIHEGLLRLRKSVSLEPVINSYQFPIHNGMNIANGQCRMQKLLYHQQNVQTYLMWGSIHVIDIQKKKYWAKHRTLRNT